MQNFEKKETVDYFATKLSNVYFREYDACLYCILRIQATLTLHEPWSLLFLYSIMDRYNFYLLSICGVYFYVLFLPEYRVYLERLGSWRIEFDRISKISFEFLENAIEFKYRVLLTTLCSLAP